VIPDFAGYMAPHLEPLIRWTSIHILQLDQHFLTRIISDSSGMYVDVFIITLLSMVFSTGSLWLISGRLNTRTWYWFHTLVCYYLSLQLFTYGFSKIFKVQFYLPEPNILYTTVGAMGRDILYWTTMGASRAYSVFCGIIEVVPAGLLLWRRTRLAGAVIALMVMLNVTAINFSYDISVKLFSLFLLLLCLIASWPLIKRIFNRDAAVPRAPEMTSRTKRLVYALAKAAVISLILYEGLFIYFRTNNFNDDLAARPPLHGAYDVIVFTRNGDTISPLTTDSSRYRRIFIHRQGYFIIQHMNDGMEDFPLETDIVAKELILKAKDHSKLIYHYT
jgi:hypothetical protein